MVKVPVSQSVVLFAPQILAKHPVNAGPVRLYLAGTKSGLAGAESESVETRTGRPQRITERL